MIVYFFLGINFLLATILVLDFLGFFRLFYRNEKKSEDKIIHDEFIPYSIKPDFNSERRNAA